MLDLYTISEEPSFRTTKNMHTISEHLILEKQSDFRKDTFCTESAFIYQTNNREESLMILIKKHIWF